MPRPTHILPLLLGAACGESPAAAVDAAPPGHPSYDERSLILRGPYLQLPTRTSIVVLWSTDLPSSAVVEYGTTESYGGIAEGKTYRYGSSDPEQDSPSGWLHEVRINGLAASTTYHYRVASVAAPTDDATFRTAPVEGESFSIAVWGDTRARHDDHARVVEAIVAQAPDIGLFTGDFVDNAGWDEQWIEWFAVEAPLLRVTPFYPGFGNHELSGGARYDLSFVAPETALYDQFGDRSARNYSFDYGSLHALVFDAYGDRVETLAFAEADLADAAAREVPFRIALLHPPIYTYGSHAPSLDLRDELLPILRAHGVQVLFAGHNHSYERFFLGDIHHVVDGGGGAPRHDPNVRAPDVPDPRVAVHEGLSFVHASFAADVATFRALNRDGAPFDCFVVNAGVAPVTDFPCQ